MKFRFAIRIVSVQVAWLACAYSAISGYPSIGVAACVLAIGDKPALVAVVEPLLKAREVIEQQVADLDRKVMRLARSEPQVRRFMTAPGIGPITALCYLATIDDRRSGKVQQIPQCWRLCWPDDKSICVR